MKDCRRVGEGDHEFCRRDMKDCRRAGEGL